MREGTCCVGAALAWTLGLQAALAGRPFGGDDAGFVPPTKPVARCERTVARSLRKNAGCLDRCTLAAARATFLRGRPFDDERCEESCGAALVTAGGRLFATGICPPCITRFPPALIAMLTEQASNAGAGQVACAGMTPLGGDDSGFVAPDRATARCELAVGRSLGRLDRAIIRCHMRLADAAFRGKPFDEESCEDAAQRMYGAATGKLTGCPPCLDGAGLARQIRSSADAATGLIYCASPSGAFPDPAR